MYFKYILFLTLAVASKGMLNTSLSLGAQDDCTDEQFQCANGKCTSGDNRCDGFQDCKDGSDELNCTSCASSSFSCGDRKCIDKDSLCDLYDDCEDGSDENNCTNHVCSSDEFQCQSGQCIDNSSRCDGYNHCADNSDEENCYECFKLATNSTGNPFKCVSSDKCISQFKLCDSVKDCPDGSDEDQATCQNLQCAEDEIKCRAGRCVRKRWFCDGYDPCGEDYKTEKSNYNCTECPSYMFKCDTENKCVDKKRLCDTVPDCEDGSDESESTCSVLKCGPGEFQCRSGQCVENREDFTVVCNGHYDCRDESDKSDEANCTICSPEAWKCGSGECVHKLNLCNSKVECSDKSDENEINCPHGSTPPVLTPLWRKRWHTHTPNVTLQHLTKDLAVYFDSTVPSSVTWPFLPLSEAWKYTKETFNLETLSDEPGSQFLYIVLGKRKNNYQTNFSFRSRNSGYRNVIDPGLRERNGWATENSANFEKLVSGLGNIVEIAMEGVENNADHKLCGRTLQNIVFYDIYSHLKGQESHDVVQWKANQFNQTLKLGKYNCFRDWYLPVYEKYGGTNVLNNYFYIFKTNWPKKLGVYSEFTYFGHEQLNLGEFVHFWSGAAGEDLRYLAKSAFNDWDDVFMRQFVKAQTDFPTITYPRKILSGNHWRTVNLNYMEKSGSHSLRSLEGQAVNTKKVIKNIQEKYLRGLN